MIRLLPIPLSLLFCASLALRAGAHCEIPCGIFADEMRFDMIDEHLTTIEKSMTEIVRLSAEGEKNYNQIVRWVVNKEEHCAELREIVVVYFLDQRIKPAEERSGEAHRKYLEQLETLHAMLLSIVKCKQTTDTEHVTKLRELRARLYVLYFGKDHVRHTHEGGGH